MASSSKKHSQFHACKDCEYSTLVIYRKGNPVCSVCNNGGDKDLARRMHECFFFRQAEGEKEIIKGYEQF